MERNEVVTLTCMCMIYDENDNILVQNKINDNYTGITFPGGHVEKKESFTTGVIREIYEETGLHIEHPALCGIYNWIREDDTRYIVLLYKANCNSGILKASEEGDVFWVPKDEFNQMELAPGMKEVLKICCEDNLIEDFLYKDKQGWVEILQ